MPGVPPGDFWWSLGTLEQIGWENLRSLTENLDARKTIERVLLHFYSVSMHWFCECVFFFVCACFFLNVSILHLSTNFQFPNFVFNPKICRSFQVFPRLFQHVSTNYLLQIQPISTHESSMIVNRHYIPSKIACVLINKNHHFSWANPHFSQLYPILITIFPREITFFAKSPSFLVKSPVFPWLNHTMSSPNHHLSHSQLNHQTLPVKSPNLSLLKSQSFRVESPTFS